MHAQLEMSISQQKLSQNLNNNNNLLCGVSTKLYFKMYKIYLVMITILVFLSDQIRGNIFFALLVR